MVTRKPAQIGPKRQQNHNMGHFVADLYVSVGKDADTDTKASPGNPLMLLVMASRLSSGEAGRNMSADPPRGESRGGGLPTGRPVHPDPGL